MYHYGSTHINFWITTPQLAQHATIVYTPFSTGSRVIIGDSILISLSQFGLVPHMIIVFPPHSQRLQSKDARVVTTYITENSCFKF